MGPTGQIFIEQHIFSDYEIDACDFKNKCNREEINLKYKICEEHRNKKVNRKHEES